MPSVKRNSITAKAIDLTSLLFNVASSRDVPLRQLLQLQCLYRGSTKVYLCSPFLSPLPHRWRFVVAPLRGFMEDLVTAVIAEVFNMLSFCLNRSVNCYTTLNMKRDHRSFAFSPWLIDPRGCTVTSGFSVIPYSGKKILFMFSSVYSAVQRGKHTQIQSLLAYELFVKRCGTCKNNIHGHSFVWSGACEFTKYYNCYKKSKQTSVRKICNFMINRDHSNKK